MSDYNNTHSNNTNDDLYDDDYITYEETNDDDYIDDDVLDPAGDIQKAVLVDLSHVSCFIPTVLGKRGARSVLIFQIFHHAAAAHDLDLTLVRHPSGVPLAKASDRARFIGFGVCAGVDTGCFGRAVKRRRKNAEGV